MANALRTLVSKKKVRYQEGGFDLDLTYITNRVIAMGFPSTGMEGVYRNPLPMVQKFFNTKHEKHYKVYNLCSERAYDINGLFHRVECFGFDDHNPCPVEMLGPMMDSLDRWLAESELNVAGIHCKAGKVRSGGEEPAAEGAGDVGAPPSGAPADAQPAPAARAARDSSFPPTCCTPASASPRRKRSTSSAPPALGTGRASPSPGASPPRPRAKFPPDTSSQPRPPPAPAPGRAAKCATSTTTSSCCAAARSRSPPTRSRTFASLACPTLTWCAITRGGQPGSRPARRGTGEGAFHLLTCSCPPHPRHRRPQGGGCDPYFVVDCMWADQRDDGQWVKSQPKEPVWDYKRHQRKQHVRAGAGASRMMCSDAVHFARAAWGRPSGRSRLTPAATVFSLQVRKYRSDEKFVDLDCSAHNVRVRGNVKLTFYDEDVYSADDKARRRRRRRWRPAVVASVCLTDSRHP